MKKYLKTFVSTLVIVGVVTIASAWVGPSLPPTGGNVDAPINTGTIGQIKSGGLTVGSGSVTYGLLVPNGNVGIGTTTPLSKLSIAGDLNVTGSLKISDSAGTSGYVLQSRGSTLSPQWVATSTIFSTNSSDYVPSGAIMAFDLSACPTGWSELTYARGRYIVGLPLSGTRGLSSVVGTALTNMENRATGYHRHGAGTLSASTANTGDTNNTGSGSIADVDYDGSGTVSMTVSGYTAYTSGTDGVPGTNAPYIQYLYCKKI